MIRSDELESAWPGLIEAWMGSGTVKALRTSPPESSDGQTIVFAGQPEQLQEALQRKAGIIVASGKLTPPHEVPQGVRLFKCQNVGLAMSAILPRFDRKAERFQQKSFIHAQAAVDPTAKIGKNVVINAFAVIGARCEIGDNAIIGSNCVIELEARIGHNTLLHPQVFVGAQCEIGNECEVHPHVTIGADGFGFARDQEGRYHKLPQLGRVIVGDRVEIGGNTVIDRAAFTVTRIGSGTKIDNLCHIAHNCDIGEDSALAAGFMTAGSTKIGKRFMTGGSTVVADHLTLADDVMLSGRTTLTFDLEKGGGYGGYPTQPMKDHLRSLAVLPHLPQMKKQISKILKHLGLNEEKE